MKAALAAAAIAACASLSRGVAVPADAGLYGFDAAVPISAAQASCLRSHFSFAAMRVTHSNASFDVNSVSAFTRLQTAGFAPSQLSGYVWPCPSIFAPAAATTVIKGLASHGIELARVYLDVETNPVTSCQFGVPAEARLRGARLTEEQAAASCQWLKEFILALQQGGLDVAVYSSAVEWAATVGASCDAGAGLPLWYAHYETPPQPSFADFVKFGPWTAPSAKQYMGTDTDCDTSIDRSWAPSGGH